MLKNTKILNKIQKSKINKKKIVKFVNGLVNKSYERIIDYT